MKILYLKEVVLSFTILLLFSPLSYGNQVKFYNIENLMFFDCYEEALDSISVIDIDSLTKTDIIYYSYLKGETLLFLNQYNQSLEEFMFVYQSPNNAFTNKVKSRLAYLFYMSGDYEKSIDLIYEIAKEEHSYSDRVVLAKSHTELKQFEIAHRMYDELLKEKNSDYNNLQKAHCFIKENKYQLAIDIYYKLINDHEEIQMVFYNNLLYCLNKINPFEASNLYAKVDSFLFSNKDVSPQRIGVYSQNKAEYLSFLNCHDEAVYYIDQAILIYFGIDNISDIDLISNRDKKSLLDFYEEKIKILKNAESNEILNAYKYVDKIIYYLKMEAVEDNIMYRKGDDFNKYYKEASLYFIDKRQYETAYFFISKLKDSALDQNLLLKRQNLFESKNKILKLYNEQHHDKIDSASRNKLRIEALSDFNQANSEDYFDKFDLKAFQNKLSKRDLILDYYLIDTTYYLFAITNEKVSLHQLSLEDALIKELKTEFTTKPSMDSWTEAYQEQINHLSERLYKQIIPIDHKRNDNLIIIPHGIIHGFAFEALRKDQSYLLDNALLSYSSSIKLLDRVLTEPYETSDNLLFSFKNHMYLHGSSAEKTELTNLYDFKNTYKLLHPCQQEFQANIIHFTDHAESNETHLESNIRIDSNKVFKVRDFLNGNLKANLLVLAGCETAVGKEILNEGVYGLSRSGFISGAKSIISSFQHINDDSTAEIIKSTYKFIHLGYPVNKSVTLAKRAYIDKETNYYQHPYFWSGLIVEGNYKIKPVEKKFRLAFISKRILSKVRG